MDKVWKWAAATKLNTGLVYTAAGICGFCVGQGVTYTGLALYYRGPQYTVTHNQYDRTFHIKQQWKWDGNTKRHAKREFTARVSEEEYKSFQ